MLIRGRRQRRASLAALALVVFAVVAAVRVIQSPHPAATDPTPSVSAATSPTEPAGAPPAGTDVADTARQALARLVIRPDRTVAGYDRSCSAGHGCVFGPAWSDVDHDGCDQRSDVLRRDLVSITTKPDTHGCVVASGILHDPYTGQTISYRRGPAGAAVQIDHVVPLGAAWSAGAATWSPHRRNNFANDLGNLLAVDGPANESKGDRTADQWRPPNSGSWCLYARITVTVDTRWHLTISSADRAALAGMLTHCPPKG